MQYRNVATGTIISRSAMIIGLIALPLSPVAAQTPAQAFPTKLIRIISPFEAGGSTDLLARLLQPKFVEAWKQTVIIENRPGAGGNTGADFVAKAPPDGHTLLIVASNHAINPALYKNMPFDARQDLAPTALIGKAANVLIVNPSIPVNSVKDLIAYARQNSGANFASGGSGAASHIIGEMFKHAAGVNLTHVPYKGSGPALIGMLRGDTTIYFSNMVAAMSHVKSGKVRLIAVTSATRNRALPDTPTIAESGLPGFEADNWYGVLTTGKSPLAAVQAINRVVQQAVLDPQNVDKLNALGITPEPMSVEQFTAFVDSEFVKWRKAVELAGAVVD